jgi:hypothetical protein
MSKYVGKIVTNQAPAGYSVFFDGSGDFLTLPANAAFNFGTGNFTVEFWLYFQNSTGFQTIFDISYTTSPNLVFQASSGAMAVYMNGASTVLAASAVSNGTWNHFALVRSGTTVTLYLNGASVNTATYSGNVGNSTSIVYVGGSLGGGGYYLNGYLSNVRVVKGTALYTAAFTPPTQLLNITNTSLLTCNSPAVIDQSSNAFAITVNGNAAPSTFTPFVAYNPAPTSAFPLTPAPGVWTLDEALQYTQQGVWPSPIANAIEDVFSTFLYTGDGSGFSVNNGIDLSGKGGMVWLKDRTSANIHELFDTNRGATYFLRSNGTDAQSQNSNTLSAFNNNGFSIGDAAAINTSTNKYASWTFREQAKFFDVVTYTGNNASNRAISHNLGSTPGFILVKATSTTGDWYALHRVGNSGSWGVGTLNSTGTFSAPSPSFWGNGTTFTAPTSTTFTVSADGGSLTNGSGITFVAYLFAHDAGGFGPTGTDNVISCGSFTTDGSGVATVNLGYEPQWVMFKASSTTSQWPILDSMRGWTNPANNARLFANLSNAETSGDGQLFPTATGFASPNGGLSASATYIYIAIRRGPMRPPSSGTSVFTPIKTGSGSTLSDSYASIGFPIDMTLRYQTGTNTAADYKNVVFTRLLGINSGATDAPTSTNAVKLLTPATDAVSTGAIYYSQTGSMGLDYGGSWTAPSYVLTHLHFRRAPGFFDVVCYSGNGTAGRAVNHNLQVVPEMMIIKRRDDSSNWRVYAAAIGNTRNLELNSDLASAVASSVWNDTSPTTSVFTVGTNLNVNGNTFTYVAYLFATVGGVSKVGSYKGTGTTQQINCGFTNGSRFVMIKRTDSTGDWYVWDSARGIVAGNDPYLLLNSTAAEVTNTDFVDTYSLGFELSSTAPAALNASGGNYIFLAIA